MLDVIPGNAGIGLVAGADGTGDLLPAKRKEREDSFSRAEVLCQVEAHPKKEPGQKERDILGNCTVHGNGRTIQEQAGTRGNKEDAGDGVGEALIRWTGGRVPCACRDPGQHRGADLPGKLDDKPCQRAEDKLFRPGHVDIRKDRTDTGAGAEDDDKERIFEDKGTAGNEGAYQGKYDMMPGNHDCKSSSLLMLYRPADHKD